MVVGLLAPVQRKSWPFISYLPAVFDIIAVRRVSRVPDRHARVVIAVVPVLDQLTHVCCIDCILMPASCGGA